MNKQVVVYISNYNICAVVNAFVLTLCSLVGPDIFSQIGKSQRTNKTLFANVLAWKCVSKNRFWLNIVRMLVWKSAYGGLSHKTDDTCWLCGTSWWFRGLYMQISNPNEHWNLCCLFFFFASLDQNHQSHTLRLSFNPFFLLH